MRKISYIPTLRDAVDGPISRTLHCISRIRISLSLCGRKMAPLLAALRNTNGCPKMASSDSARVVVALLT